MLLRGRRCGGRSPLAVRQHRRARPLRDCPCGATMCFSAPASFTLSGILIGVGAASVARSATPAHRMLAAAPLLFGAQQAAEGLVWLTAGAPSNAALQRLAVDVFLGFALVVWPFWVPLSLQRIERSPARRRILTWLCWFSGVVSLSAAVLVSRWQPFA
ncbi:MAG TPA: DUF6629 family protein, partial [Acidimicrobiia bacterium]|nr:DUF6629 family protein [Acidimicrobiia bacterium]